MEQRNIFTIIAILGGVLVLGAMSVFTVGEQQRALLFRLGEVVKSDYGPGLHFKLPLITNVRTFDARILTLEAPPERYLTAEKKNVIVDSFVKWKISDVSRYYTTMGGDEERANVRLAQLIKTGLRDEFGKRTIQEVVSGEREQIMAILRTNASKQAQEFGINVVDVRIKRIDLPDEVSSSVFQRMEAERSRVAKDLRSRGAEAAERIRADADRQRTVIIAEAYREAERLRGEGDAEASDIYAQAFKKNPEFYAFYRSMTAYKATFKSPSDIMVVDPNSEFFKYFKNPNPR
ncbi:MAG: protease modulator HflC [Gammaproteobacteria bacterium]|nr:protease modulator HflC [Gammaproteobacteria bacterium]